MEILKGIVIALVAMAAIYGGLVTFGAWRWSVATGALITRLDAGDTSGHTQRYDAREIADLPAPVRRYFELALTDGQPIIRASDAAMTGTFNMSLDVPQWKPFSSQQRVVTHRPGFVWNARIMLFSGFPVRVHDAYVAGTGILSPSIFGLFSMGNISGTGEPARGELMRWFAECAWYPTALLPSQGIEWQAVDATSAQASMTDGPIRLTMLFRFGDDGLISSIHADARGALVAGQTMMMPWEGRFSDYRRQDGMLIPFYGEVAWITPQGEKPYFRGTVTQMTYRFVD
ncbi:hypothetical protein VT06_06655 [Arsukibacterium sp. MJ3]|uniref:DUF6544 family protein n=1 Tax=Arsukibacterium sp. MJ3 TaxID=1632859 RepID=UPI00062725BD|nr:DUF6544 family protein [Arsukibacterium sp. MJ3]KKO49505.1 hypothetical protein VT06_06655 [Arsukibacterium sp. MJ3]